MNTRILSVAFCVALASITATVTAVAADSTPLSAPLGDIEWGASRDTVVNKVKEQLLDKIRSRDDLRGDHAAMQRAHKSALAQVQRFKHSYEKLDDVHDYQVSVIADEFAKGNGESLMRLKDRVANRYYFLIDGGVYKLVVAYNQSYLEGIDFRTFVIEAARKYGKPDETTYGSVNGQDGLVSATWTDETTILKVRNQKEFFDTYTMSFAERSTAKRLRKVHGASAKDAGKSNQVSRRVESLTSADRDKADRDVVDSIVGDSEIDLNQGRPTVPEDDQDDQDDQQVASKASDKDANKPKSAKKPDTDDRAKSKSSGGGLGEIDETSSDDDLIIY